MSFRLLLIAAGSVALAACNTAGTHIGDEDPGMGEALAYDKAIQTINPAPVYPADAARPGDSGAKGALNVKKYRNGDVKPVENIGTSSRGGGGGGGGGGGEH